MHGSKKLVNKQRQQRMVQRMMLSGKGARRKIKRKESVLTAKCNRVKARTRLAKRSMAKRRIRKQRSGLRSVTRVMRSKKRRIRKRTKRTRRPKSARTVSVRPKSRGRRQRENQTVTGRRGRRSNGNGGKRKGKSVSVWSKSLRMSSPRSSTARHASKKLRERVVIKTTPSRSTHLYQRKEQQRQRLRKKAGRMNRRWRRTMTSSPLGAGLWWLLRQELRLG
mmetsp:Transcript_102495/g.256801  ORF Transcript_102495/g.256801 Transcript_102495/m.256801 type:complete len:222 (+) Transcript_102495:661-1326(+)